MIIYSITVSIQTEIEYEWLNWMHDVHIPDVMKTGFFKGYSIQKLLDPKPQKGMETYNIQYTCESLSKYARYRREAAPALQKEHTERYKNRFVAFRTILRQIRKG